ncbi:unnamed protein product [Pleuronectes platessa]|uniref:Uncharacterized protein n=1 Tax=Pleuronectes platessa TaxID=8262 RepID=A0A9N7UIM7_PLEPL|nr:unnamed protein product [Pleuronectes platessa]
MPAPRGEASCLHRPLEAGCSLRHKPGLLHLSLTRDWSSGCMGVTLIPRPHSRITTSGSLASLVKLVQDGSDEGRCLSPVLPAVCGVMKTYVDRISQIARDRVVVVGGGTR